MRLIHGRPRFASIVMVAAASLCTGLDAQAPPSVLDADLGMANRVLGRMAIASRPAPRGRLQINATTPAERRALVDTVWGPGLSPAESLAIFDKFWNYVDAKFAAFQGIQVDWVALKNQYRPEVAAGVSRGRLAAIINHMSVALRDGHTIPIDVFVNYDSLPGPGVPLFGVGGWILDTSGTCSTAQDDGSALVYDVLSPHPMGLVPGDRVLGYDGVPWKTLVQQLLDEELPLWPIWWGSGPKGFEHTFVMSATLNWHLFETMDVLKQSTGLIEHVPTSLMPGIMFSNFCSEQMAIAGVPKPTYYGKDFVRRGIVEGTNIGYIYVWGWAGNAPEEFAAAVRDLTQTYAIDGLIIDFRFNVGGALRGPLTGLAALFEHPSTTLGMDERMRANDHLKMKSFAPPSQFKVDFDQAGHRDRSAYSGKIAVLTGPGAVSAGDFGAIWADLLPNARTFGKTTAMATGYPTQPFLGTELNLHPNWEATVAETNTYRVGNPQGYLIHTDFVVDEPVWLRPDDVAAGKDTVVEAAIRWLKHP